MKKEHRNTIPLNLQLFAEGGADSSAEGGTSEGEAGGNQSQTDNSGARTFTQDEVNAIGTKEKNQGKNSILKLFGCADESTAKAEAEEFKKWKEAQKTEEQKKSEEEQKLRNSASESEKRAIIAESKVTVLSAGVMPESVDDVIAIAMRKVTEEKPLEKVIEEMKKESRYSSFFGGSSSAGGTGSSADHQKGGQSNSGNIGERLAKSKVSKASPKSNFFKN